MQAAALDYGLPIEFDFGCDFLQDGYFGGITKCDPVVVLLSVTDECRVIREHRVSGA